MLKPMAQQRGQYASPFVYTCSEDFQSGVVHSAISNVSCLCEIERMTEIWREC